MRNIILLVLAMIPIMVDAQSRRLIITDEDRMRADQLDLQRQQRQPSPEQLRAWQQTREAQQQQQQNQQMYQRAEEARRRTQEIEERNNRFMRQAERDAQAQRCSGYTRAPGGRHPIQGC